MFYTRMNTVLSRCPVCDTQQCVRGKLIWYVNVNIFYLIVWDLLSIYIYICLYVYIYRHVVLYCYVYYRIKLILCNYPINTISEYLYNTDRKMNLIEVLFCYVRRTNSQKEWIEPTRWTTETYVEWKGILIKSV